VGRLADLVVVAWDVGLGSAVDESQVVCRD
jgi:hypothetical protein